MPVYNNDIVTKPGRLLLLRKAVAAQVFVREAEQLLPVKFSVLEYALPHRGHVRQAGQPPLRYTVASILSLL